MILAFFLFNLFVLLMLFLDLGVFHKKDRVMKTGEAIGWSLFWIALAALFAFGIYLFEGGENALLFTTGYLVEKFLSVDNIFIFLLIFTSFKVDFEVQHKILFWGVIGALVMRAVFIAIGITLIHFFHFILYPLALFLLIIGVRILSKDPKKFQPEDNWLYKLIRSKLPLTQEYHGNRFFISIDGKWLATPLFLVLILIEITDLIFAIDSIPAVLAITLDPFLVYTSNVFAILGLRSLYFVLASLMPKFRYLHIGLGFILLFIGLKMLFKDLFTVPIEISLLVICLILIISMVVSFKKKVS